MADPITKSTEATQVAEAAELGRKLAVAQQDPKKATGLDAVPYIVLRDKDGNEVINWIEKTLTKPHRKTGTVKLCDADSFIAYYTLHSNGAPVYATLTPAQFVAVMNDHTKDQADWRDYRASFQVRHSPEWDVWKNHDGSGKTFNNNESFALFIEENAPDIVSPDPARMLQIALNFRVNADVRFSVAQRLNDGNHELAYQNVVSATAGSSAGGKLQIPEKFTIAIPVWAGIDAKKYKIEARFRYRLREGALTIWYELIRPRNVMEQAFKDLWDQIAKATKAPILHGTPE